MCSQNSGAEDDRRLDRLESLVEQQQERRDTNKERSDEIQETSTKQHSEVDRHLSTQDPEPVLITDGGQENAKIIGHNTEDSGETIGVWGEVDSENGYGIATPDDVKIEGTLDAGDDFSLDLGMEAVDPGVYSFAIQEPGSFTDSVQGEPEISASGNVLFGYLNRVWSGVIGGVVSGGGREHEMDGVDRNNVRSHWSAIGGGSGNRIGDHNSQRGTAWGTISGGKDNQVIAQHGTVGGGRDNEVTGSGATVAGGRSNEATGSGSAIVGGQSNTADGTRTVIGGGWANQTDAEDSAVSGGRNNTANADYAAVGGGQDNQAINEHATVSGGENNEASDTGATVGGGEDNESTQWWATVAGGRENVASGGYSAIGGGWGNLASDRRATIAGGRDNEATDEQATVAGGLRNKARGSYSMIPGGVDNVASGAYSFAAGRQASAEHMGTFVWADSGEEFASTGNNQFLIEASNGVGIGTNSPDADLEVAGDVGIDGDLDVDGNVESDVYVEGDVVATDDLSINANGTDDNTYIRFRGDDARIYHRELTREQFAFSGIDEVIMFSDLRVRGDLEVDTDKDFVQPHAADPTKQIHYTAVEGGESGVYCRGSDRIETDRVVVDLPDHFATVASDEELTAQLTPRGGWAPLYVENVTPEQLVVAVDESYSGEDVAFDYTVNGLREHFEDKSVIRENEKYRPEAFDSLEEFEQEMNREPRIRDILIENGILQEDGSVDEQTVQRLEREFSEEAS